MSKINNSFGLFRTNPKLTSNYKLTVRSNNRVSINAIQANPTLSSIRYVNLPLNRRNTFSNAINRLYDGGTLKSAITFEVKKNASDEILQQDFRYQYEDVYMCGLTRTKSKIYQEEFSYFAPLYLRKDIPKYFVIFRVAGAANLEFSKPQTNLIIGLTYRVVGPGKVLHGGITYTNLQQFKAVSGDYAADGEVKVYLDDASYFYNYIQNPSNFRQFLSNCEIAKIYDIANGTLGSLLNGIITDPNFAPYPLEVDFDNSQVSYRGIHIPTGVITQVVEDIDEIIKTETTITEFDEYITQGFERNNIINANCINIEFLFNDEVAEDYKFYRYFGLYLDTLPIGKYFPDKSMFKVAPTDTIYPFLDCLPINYQQTFVDLDGIKIKPDLKTLEGVLFEPELLDRESIFYIKGVDNNLFKIDNKKSQSFKDYTYVTKDTSMSIRSLHGFSDFIQISGSVLPTPGRSTNILTVESEFEYGDYIDFFDGKRLVCRLIPDDLPDWNANAYPDYIDGIYEEGRGLGPYFFPRGTTSQIAIAIAEAFNASMPKIYNIDAIAVGNQVFMISRVAGSYNNIIRISTSRKVHNKHFTGGTDTAKARIRVSSDIIKDVNEYSYVRTLNGYCRIASIAPYIDEPDFGPDGQLDGFDKFDSFVVLSIDSPSESIDVKHGQTIICELSKMEFGVLSFYDFKDFDFDFIKSDYNKYPSSEYKKYFAVENLEIGHQYTVYTRPDSAVPAVIEHNGVQYNNGSSFTAVNNTYQVISGIAVIIDAEYEYDEELKQFIGFNTLNGQQGISQSISSLINTDLLQNKSYLFATSVKTEYEYLREDVNPNLVLRSKTLPTITKWVSFGGTDIRGNKYRLNVSRAFGELGFSPSFFNYTQNPKFFTHEWPYLVGAPKNISLPDLLDSQYFTLPFNRDRMRSITQDYFSRYFTVDYVVYESQNVYEAFQIKRDVRYTEIDRLNNGSLTTFFRGVRINFEPRLAGNNITRLAGYKFSTILRVKRSTYLLREPQVDFEILEQKKFKNITFIITLVVDDYKMAPGEDQNGELYPDYVSMYVTQSLKKYNNPGYLYGLNYNFFNFIILGLFNSVGGLPVLPKITSFRGFQMPSAVNYQNYGGAPNIVRFDDFYDISTFLKPVATWDNVNKVPVIAGNFGRLITMDATKFTAVTSDPIYFSAQQLLFDKPNTIRGVIAPRDVVLATSGIAIINNPGQVTNANYDPLDINTGIYGMQNLVWFYENGGVGAYAQAMQLLSFASIQEDINDREKYVRYTTIDEDGIESTGTDFKLNIIAPSQITRTRSLSLVSQKVVLPGLPQNAAEIFNGVFQPSAHSINRFGGQFEPKTREILKFQDDYLEMKWALEKDTWTNASYNWLKSQLAQIRITWGLTSQKWQNVSQSWNSLAINKDAINQGTVPFSDFLIGQNTRFIVNNEFGLVENMGYHRVNQAQATVFKTNTLKYPQVDEIAIATRNINALNSNWEMGYFTEILDKFNSVDTYGTRNLTETKAALGSKALAIPDIVKYANFSYAAGVVDPKLANNQQVTDIVYDNSSNIRQLRFFIDMAPKFNATVFEKSKDEFYKYFTIYNISTNSIDDSINQYIANNILPVFKVGEIKVYVKSTKDPDLALDLFVSGDNEIALLQAGYVRTRNVGYRPIGDLKGIFTLQIPDNSRVSVALIISLNKI